MAIIQAVCGTLVIPGGTIAPVTTPFDQEGTAGDVLRRMLPPARLGKKLGIAVGHFLPDDLCESIVNKPAELQPQYLVDSLLDDQPYPIKAALVLGSNPLLTWCNSRRVYAALQNIDFLAVADLVMTPTAALADIVLPVCSYLEADGIVVKHKGRGDTGIAAQQKIVRTGECRSDLEITNALAQRLGAGQYFWPDSTSYLDHYLARAGITFDELRRRDLLITSGMRYRKYVTEGFATPSGKVELYSGLCRKWGYEPFPVYRGPKETPFSSPDMVRDYPLTLTSAHEPDYIHSQDRYLHTICSQTPEPLVLIHPDTAAGYGISDGDPVVIENIRGHIIQKARLSSDVDPRVISVAYGWWFPKKGADAQFGWDLANFNVLTDDSPPFSAEIGSPGMRGFMCRISKAPHSISKSTMLKKLI